MKNCIKMLLSGTALCLPLFGAAYAQSPSQNQGNQCQALRNLINQADARTLEQFGNAQQVADADASDDCAALIVMIEKSDQGQQQNAQGTQQNAQGTSQDQDTQTRNFTASDMVSDTVKITKKAVVQGEVAVQMPKPEVDVQQQGAQVKVQPGHASINVDQQAPNIEVRQAKATIQVQLPQPVITIDQPAPEIIVTMPRPGVSLDQAQPTVQVSTPEPTVTFSQAEPKVNVDVDAKLVDPNSPEAQQAANNQVTTRIQREDAGQGAQGQQANVRIDKAEPNVQVANPGQNATVVYNQAGQPTVDYRSTDPDVNVSFVGDPEVHVRQVGEPKVTFNPAQTGQDQAQQQDQDASRTAPAAQPTGGQGADQPRRLSDEDTARLLGVPQSGAASVTGTKVIPAAQLIGREVVNSNGDNIGEVSRVVSNQGGYYVVVSYGGFLGFGSDEVALPGQRVALRSDDVLLLGLTQDDLDAMPEYDAGREQQIANDQPLRMNTVEQ